MTSKTAKTHASSQARTHRPRRKAAPRKSPRKRWSAKVTETSDAMTLEDGVFQKKDPDAIARSVKRSAEASDRRKSEPYRSAMSMLSFYVNRAGRNLSPTMRRVLEAAKERLRALFGRADQHPRPQRSH